jgi:CheY-like chemotaxis protein
MKDEFLATLSHELRTPLNAILGWAQLLGRGGLKPEDAREGMQTIERNARAQAALISDLLDMSRIISGKLRLDVHSVELHRVVAAACETIRPAANARNIAVEAEVAEITVRGDPNRLQQIVWNLLSNAVKFTPPGGRARVEGAVENGNAVLRVSDTGTGIDPEFMPYLFDRFRQKDASTTRSHRGLGLGLAIVKQLTELHGGTVYATSAAGKGTMFVVTLPLGLAALESDDPAALPSHTEPGDSTAWSGATLRGIQVLLVDDDDDARDVARRVLEGFGASVLTANCGAEALRVLTGAHPDVLVCDISMPEMDGYQLIREVRSRYPADEQIPAIAWTAFARPEDRQQALANGYNAHVSKPLEPLDLTASILLVLQEQQKAASPAR